MELLGDKNWWLPRWLDRALPDLDIEGARLTDARPPAQPRDRERAALGR
jgi:RND superfamily putative drug exporter